MTSRISALAATMVRLLNLPQEILQDVFVRLKPADLKNIGFTCKTFGDVAAETLLPAIHVVFTKHSFERLRDVSLHPIFSLYVNEIIYEADRLDHYEDREEWERRIIDEQCLDILSHEALVELQTMPPEDPMRMLHQHSTEEIDHGWTRYKALHKEQLVSASNFLH
jgi:F-box-like